MKTDGQTFRLWCAWFCGAWLCTAPCGAEGPGAMVRAPVLGADATCIGIYHRYPEVPTTAEAALDDMKALGVEHLLFWVSTKEFYPAYAVEGPEFARFGGLMRERGLRLIAAVGTMLRWPQWAKDHPDWVMVNPKGEPNQYGYPCWSNPDVAQEAHKTTAAIVAQAVESADDLVSAWSLYDEVLWGWVNDNCHCSHCQAGYRAWLERKGHAPGDVGFGQWEQVTLATSPTAAHNALHATTSNEYREDTLIGFLAEEAAIVKRLDPRRRPVTSAVYPLVAQSTCALHGNHARKWQRALDFIMTDPYPAGDPCTNFSLQVVSPLIATLRDPSGRTPVLLIVQDFASTVPGNMLPIPSQIRKLCFQAIGYGATGLVPFIYDCGLKKDAEGKLTQERYPKRNEFERIAHWLRDPLISDLICRARPLPSVGVVFPQNWYRRYGPGHPWSGELEQGFSIFRDLFQNHYQVSVLFPEDLAEPAVLSRYRAIVATGVWDVGPEFGIGPAAERAVRAFVEQGGALLVSGRTGLMPLAREVRSEPAKLAWRGMLDLLPTTSRAAMESQPDDQVLARYDDGAPAALVRRVEQGRVAIMPAIFYRERLTDGERYVESERRYVFDGTEAVYSGRARAVRQAVGDAMAALEVPRPVSLHEERGETAWYVQPMTLEGEGYWLVFIINWPGAPHTLRLRVHPPEGEAWLVKDLFTGETLSPTREDLAAGWPVRLEPMQVRALALAWEPGAAHRLGNWQPSAPYAPVAE